MSKINTEVNTESSTVIIDGKEITYTKAVIDENTKPQDLWEPAKPDERPDDVWIPNRKERRQMMNAKGRKRGLRALGQMFQETENYAKRNPQFRQDLYKALYENLKIKAAEKEEEFKKEINENGRADEGN